MSRVCRCFIFASCLTLPPINTERDRGPRFKESLGTSRPGCMLIGGRVNGLSSLFGSKPFATNVTSGKRVSELGALGGLARQPFCRLDIR